MAPAAAAAEALKPAEREQRKCVAVQSAEVIHGRHGWAQASAATEVLKLTVQISKLHTLNEAFMQAFRRSRNWSELEGDWYASAYLCDGALR